MAKKYFVLKEDTDCDNYPTLVRVKDYCNQSGSETPTSPQLASQLKKEGYITIETETNIILTALGTQ